MAARAPISHVLLLSIQEEALVHPRHPRSEHHRNTWITGLESLLAFFPQTWKPPPPPMAHDSPPSALATLALDKVLKDASPIFGHPTNIQSSATLSSWMSNYPDSTKLVRMNVPGAHDAATWNYSAATQQALKPVTRLVSDTVQPPEWFRCQDGSIVDMLNAGIRAFDLRYALDVTNSTLVFWHGPALLSQTATVDGVLFGFYTWLEEHSSEVLFLSFQFEGNEKMGNVDSADVQLQLYNTLTSPAAQKYVLQTRNEFGTLGAARGKIILLRRFDLDLLPPSYEENIPGIHFSPKKWTANSASLALTYNSDPSSNEEEGMAYIEDYYHPLTLPSSTLAENIEVKFNATQSHLLQAASDAHPDGLFWTFASGTNVRNDAISVTPRLMALGDGSGEDVKGVNHRLVELMKGMEGKRLGIVMFDFLEEPGELVEVFLGLKEG